MRTALIALSLAALAAPVLAQDGIPAALADPRRPAEDVERDAARHTSEVLEVVGVQPGDQVADLVVGGGYWTRLFAAQVGAEGHVTAWQPGEFVAFQASYGEQLREVDAAYDNVTGIEHRFAELDLPDGLDRVFTAQNYHDFHLDPFPAETASRVNAEVYSALEPCGRYFVIDHDAMPGTGFSISHTLHRAERGAVVEEVEAAGFRLIDESDLLRREEPMDVNVFDDLVRGRTSQFFLVFQKPGDACPVEQEEVG